MLETFTPYSTAQPFFGGTPMGWLSEYDMLRINSYNLYEQVYDNVPEAFSVARLGSDGNPIYVPAAKTIIESTNRFLAQGFTFHVDPVYGQPAAREEARLMFENLFIREEMLSKFAVQKRYGLIRGDAIWHIVGNPDKPEGGRVSIYDIDPAAYFPIEDPNLPGRVVGCHLVTQELVGEEVLIRRRTYRKTEAGQIETSLTLFELDGWDDRILDAEMKQVQILEPPRLLDPRITSLPVYHVKNNRQTENPFGASELKGYERILAAVNQSISDTDLALAMQGLGVYTTTSGPPTNSRGEELDWMISPGRVLEIAEGSKFERVKGVDTVAPSLDHVNFLLDQVMQAQGVSDIARGRVEVSVAESGIALYLQMAPILSKNEEKELEMLPKFDHMFFDLLTMWFPVYEGKTLDVKVHPAVTDPLPTNRDAEIEKIFKMLASGITTKAHARTMLMEYGYTFPETIEADLVTEAEADPFAQRVRDEGAL